MKPSTQTPYPPTPEQAAVIHLDYHPDDYPFPDDGCCWAENDHQGKRPEQVAFSSEVCYWLAIGALVAASLYAGIAVGLSIFGLAVLS